MPPPPLAGMLAGFPPVRNPIKGGLLVFEGDTLLLSKSTTRKEMDVREILEEFVAFTCTVHANVCMYVHTYVCVCVCVRTSSALLL